MQDTSGTYYWHIPTGTTQWEPPSGLARGSAPGSPGNTPFEEPPVSCDRGDPPVLGPWGCPMVHDLSRTCSPHSSPGRASPRLSALAREISGR